MLELSWLLPLAILFQEMNALKKEKKEKEREKEYEEIKRGKCPDKCPTVELGVQYTHLR